MHGTRLVFALLVLALVGCDSGECVLDTDCTDFGLVCIESRCVPPGAVDAGGGAADGGAVDGGGGDAGTVQEDAGQGDAAVIADGGPSCPDLTTEWLAPNTMACFEAVSFTLSIAAAVEERRDEDCDYTVSGGLSGDFSVAADGAITAMIAGSDGMAVECTGTLIDDATIELTCGGCTLTLERG